MQSAIIEFWQFCCLQEFLGRKNIAIAYYTKAPEFRNDFCFRRLTEEGYICDRYQSEPVAEIQ